LSRGCRSGGNEAIWGRCGVHQHITGVDSCPRRLASRTDQARKLGLRHGDRFRTANVRDLLRAGETYDIVLGLQSLPHFDRLDDTMDRIAGLRNPGALPAVAEYDGPPRLQCTRWHLLALA
ncbi:class I SAM-dependent methyltransferase, partial [Saccharothrix sp. ST-888]|uniref:methyltransferase domain-containing protein n=1 Tax=Saccharothrix sp. ST-888 TaxID=1427391 RepID=UPI0005ECDDFC